MLRIKVCGITSERDALEAVHLGVDALGFVFWKSSPRYISPEEAAEITPRLPPFVARVGVFVDERPGVIMDTVRAAGLTSVQLHGRERPATWKALSVSWIKTVRTGEGFRAEELSRYPCTAYLIEGASGDDPEAEARPDWNIVRLAERYGRVIISGGLTADNVGAAIERIRPYAVNVSRGVELSARLKDIDKLESFVRAARAAERRLADRDGPG